MTAPERVARPLDVAAVRQQITVMRAQAEVLRRLADGLREHAHDGAAEYAEAVAFSTEHAAELLKVFIETVEVEAANQATCVCCNPGDCGDRRGHVRNDVDGGDQCNCGRDWPCDRREDTP